MVLPVRALQQRLIVEDRLRAQYTTGYYGTKTRAQMKTTDANAGLAAVGGRRG